MTDLAPQRVQPPRIQLRNIAAQHNRQSKDEQLSFDERAAHRDAAFILNDSDPRNWRRNGEHSLEDLPDSEARDLLRAAISHRLNRAQLDPTTRKMVREAFDSMATPVPSPAEVTTVIAAVTATRARNLAADQHPAGSAPPLESYASVSSRLGASLN